jgi:type IV pilus assembly protein PilC
MATFSYEAMDSSGKDVKDTVDAKNSEEAITKIRARGQFPTKCRQTDSTPEERLNAEIERTAAAAKKKDTSHVEFLIQLCIVALPLCLLCIKPIIYGLVAITCIVVLAKLVC